MRGLRFFLILALYISLGSSAWGMFAYPELEQIPIGRLYTNLQQRLNANTNDFDTTYHLARLHSMMFATNLLEVDVRKKDGDPVFYHWESSGVPQQVFPAGTPQARAAGLQHLTNAITLYERAIVLLKQSSNSDEQRWMILPTHLGLAWCFDQSGQRSNALGAYRKTLKIAWADEVTDTFNFKEWVRDAWDDVQSGKNPFHKRPAHLGPGVCYSEEVIDYMLKLLDPKKDQKEIADLNAKQTTLSKMPRAITPILIPMESEVTLAELVNDHAEVAFDLDGTGLSRNWGWITPKAAWLVFDPKGTGEIKSALQMFGNVTFWIFWRDGYAALASLDDDHDGFLRGTELKGLALWQDRNGNGVSDPGEVVPIEQFSVTAIACTGQMHPDGFAWNPNGIQFKEGSARPTYDYVMPSPAFDPLAIKRVEP